MRIVREKFLDSVKLGKDFQVRKITDAEFILYAKKEINTIFAEAVTESSVSKFSDILELVNNVCEILKIDYYECAKIKSEKRWKEGKYSCILSNSEAVSDLEG